MIIRAGRPGLLGAVARTAVVAGTAQAVAGRVNHRQQQRWAAQEPPPVAAPAPVAAATPAAPAAAPAAAVDPTELIDALRSLGELRDQGILTEAEFAAQKARLLG
jgi:hypothetical protein